MTTSVPSIPPPVAGVASRAPARPTAEVDAARFSQALDEASASSHAASTPPSTLTPPGAVAPERTPLSKTQLRGAIHDAYVARHGQEPPEALLDVLSAHVSHETAGGSKIYNFNFGGIKGVSPSGHTAHLRTHEYLGGRRVNLRDGFRAYESATAGASDYLALLEGQFSNATTKAHDGDVEGFVHGLKRRGYFTAPVGLYARSVRNHMTGDFSAAAGPTRIDLRAMQLGDGARYSYGDELLGENVDAPVLGPPSMVQVARVLDAARGAVVRLGRPVGDEGEDWT